MQSTRPITTILRFTFACFLALSTILPINNADAGSAIYDGVRSNISYSGSRETCDTGSIDFEPFSGTNRDLVWEVPGNEWCLGFTVGVGLVMYATGKATKGACVATNSQAITTGTTIIEETEEDLLEPEEPTVNPKTAAGLITRGKRCISRTRETATLRAASTAACAPPAAATPACIAAQADALNAQTEMTRCCASVFSHTLAIGAAVSALAIIYDTAKIAYENARICGSEWTTWNKIDGSWIKDKGTYQKCVFQLFTNNGDVDGNCDDTSDEKYRISDDLNRTGQAKASLKNKYYREYIYGGIEYKDDSDGHCSNPSAWDSAEREEYLGYSDDEQRYYMTGAGAASVYNCRRFLPRKNDITPEDGKSVEDAYNCCIRRSETTMCIENKSIINLSRDEVDGGNSYDREFCKLGSKCEVANVFFELFGSKKDPTYLCAQTYSVCPYNHPLGGGTEKQDFYSPRDLDHIAESKNSCQYLKHCVKIPIKPYFRRSDLKGGYISSACKNLKGDTQNVLGYTSQLVPVNSHNFTAPIAQCFKETMENIFLNKAGHSECVDGLEDPIDDVCISGYIYRRGYDLSAYNSGHEDSFFIKVQNQLQGFIKMALILSVIAFGFMILMGVPKEEISKKVIMSYVLKIGLVMYFAVGDGWQFGFMNGVLNTSNYLSELTFRPDEQGIEVNDGSGTIDKSNLDGCQFPRVNYADDNVDTKFENPAYPPGQRYLRIWDTLDCKIARALGYAPGASVPNLLMMFLAGFFTGGLGIVFVVATFFIAFLMISIAVRALHIFLLSTTAVVILMYVSPIMITLKMFKRTEKMFEAWWKQLLGFTLQPMILFAYLGILITFIDATIIGDVKFTGETRYDAAQQVTYLNDFPGDAEKGIQCTGESENSVYCIFNDYKIKTHKGLAIIGIGLPMLIMDMNGDKMQSLIVSALMLFIFMSFLDQITSFAKALVGGGSLESDWGGMAGMAKGMGKLGSGLAAVGKRAVRGGGKLGSVVARKGVEAMKSGSKVKQGGGGGGAPNTANNKRPNPAHGSDDPAIGGGSNQEALDDALSSGANDGVDEPSPPTPPPVLETPEESAHTGDDDAVISSPSPEKEEEDDDGRSETSDEGDGGGEERENVPPIPTTSNGGEENAPPPPPPLPLSGGETENTTSSGGPTPPSGLTLPGGPNTGGPDTGGPDTGGPGGPIIPPLPTTPSTPATGNDGGIGIVPLPGGGPTDNPAEKEEDKNTSFTGDDDGYDGDDESEDKMEEYMDDLEEEGEEEYADDFEDEDPEDDEALEVPEELEEPEDSDEEPDTDSEEKEEKEEAESTDESVPTPREEDAVIDDGAINKPADEDNTDSTTGSNSLEDTSISDLSSLSSDSSDGSIASSQGSDSSSDSGASRLHQQTESTAAKRQGKSSASDGKKSPMIAGSIADRSASSAGSTGSSKSKNSSAASKGSQRSQGSSGSNRSRGSKGSSSSGQSNLYKQTASSAAKRQGKSSASDGKKSPMIAGSVADRSSPSKPKKK